MLLALSLAFWKRSIQEGIERSGLEGSSEGFLGEVSRKELRVHGHFEVFAGAEEVSRKELRERAM